MSEGSIVVRRVLITPKLARKWLRNNPRNRPIRWRYVKRLARDMTRGKYDSKVLRPICILQEDLIERPEPVYARVHGRSDVQVVEYLDSVHQGLPKLDVIILCRGQ